jgi:hypothetical protein
VVWVKEFNPLVDTPVARILMLVKQSLVDVAVGRREHSAQVKHQLELQVRARHTTRARCVALVPLALIKGKRERERERD